MGLSIRGGTRSSSQVDWKASTPPTDIQYGHIAAARASQLNETRVLSSVPEFLEAAPDVWNWMEHR